MMAARYTYVEGFGHYAGPTKFGQYKMDSSWIDTDNRVWGIPGDHLYTDYCIQQPMPGNKP